MTVTFSVALDNDKKIGIFKPEDLRLATPDEIAAATRIVPKVGMLLEDKDGNAWRVIPTRQTDSTLLRGVTLDKLKYVSHADLTTTRYTIRDRVTIQGVR